MRRRFLFEWLLMALLLPLAMLWLGERPGLVEADRAVYDELMRGDRRAAPSPDLVIVGIDERSIAALGPWPWSRTLHAQLLEQLAPHAPRSVLFNVFFDTPGPPEDDARLAAAMAGLPVYLPMDLAPLPATASVPGLAPPRPGFATPVPALARAAHGLGHVNATADSDDRVRTLSGAQDAAPAQPDFARDAAWTRLSRFGFRLAGPAGSYRTVSYIDVLLGSVPPATFAGKMLLVGAVADSRLNDQLAVMGAGAKAAGLPGVEVHANAIDVLMQGRAIEFPSGTQRWLRLALPIWAALAAFMLSARYAAVSALALALLMAGLGAVALR
ncbi:MAG: CHASE2 domain-containing protein, partial [Variovorax sp.]